MSKTTWILIGAGVLAAWWLWKRNAEPVASMPVAANGASLPPKPAVDGTPGANAMTAAASS